MNAITTQRSTALEPQNLTEAMRFADLLAGSTMVPRDYQGKPANILVAMQWGREVGLGPLQALQNIAVINGRPSIWGDAAAALVRGHPACAGMREGVDGEGDARHGWCEITRRGEEPQRRTFSVADAKKAGLWGKSGPWQQYPDRMLQLRARGFALRDVFPDALRGVITAEEAEDMPPPEPRAVPNLAPAAEPPPPGSMREFAASLVKPAEEEKLPVIHPTEGGVVGVAPRAWLPTVKRALAKLETMPAVVDWTAQMKPMMASVAQAGNAALVDEAQAAIDARLAEFLVMEGEAENV